MVVVVVVVVAGCVSDVGQDASFRGIEEAVTEIMLR